MNAAFRRQTLAAAARAWRNAQPADGSTTDEEDAVFEAVLVDLGLIDPAKDAILMLDYDPESVLVVLESDEVIAIDAHGNALRGA